ncbi:hypothetical protein GGX14DRAFT_398420 [Mycena pura]|uniref:Uncharacterized protein n=1 Tax=Mycena pura TaxID=153505 RepID=A0AAD6YBK7_9AGAR|nr:hypothetical protein GGX14DRAFT_398420 [Mycena pura]
MSQPKSLEIFGNAHNRPFGEVAWCTELAALRCQGSWYLGASRGRFDQAEVLLYCHGAFVVCTVGFKICTAVFVCSALPNFEWKIARGAETPSTARKQRIARFTTVIRVHCHAQHPKRFGQHTLAGCSSIGLLTQGRKCKARSKKIVSDDEDSEREGDDEDGEGTDPEVEKEVEFFFDRDIDPNSAALRDLLALESEEPEPKISQKEKIPKSVEVKKTTDHNG